MPESLPERGRGRGDSYPPEPSSDYRPEPPADYRPEPPAGFRFEPLADALPAPDSRPGPGQDELAELPETAGMPAFPPTPDDGADDQGFRPVLDQQATRLDIDPLDG